MSARFAAEDVLGQHPPVELLQSLIRFNTSNPPGDEQECIGFINGLLTSAGCETRVLALSPQRPNLITRLAGRGDAPPLLLYGHVDVVTTARQQWQHPPFEGKLVDGYIWGRGALDMKGGIAMMLTAFLQAKARDEQPPGDVILALVSDEEAGGNFGAKFLVDRHGNLFQGVRYAIGEFGGFSFPIGKQRFYPIMVAEKQACWLRATVRGAGGHGSMPVRGQAMARLARLIDRLERRRLPVHITPVTRLMFSSISDNLPPPASLVLRGLLKPLLTDRLLAALGPKGKAFEPLFHHSVSPTIVRGGEKVNVIPGEITLDLDGRLLPGYQPDHLINELAEIIGDDVELEVVAYEPGPDHTDMGLFGTLASALREADPAGIPAPMLLPAVTDGRHFSRLGIQTYGFLPMRLPVDFNFSNTIHGTDERIPVEALEFGAGAISQVLQRFGEG